MKEHQHDMCSFSGGGKNEFEERSFLTVGFVVTWKANLVIVWNEDFKHSQLYLGIWLQIETSA